MVSIYGRSSEWNSADAARGLRDFASKLKDSNPIPTLECATWIASVKQSLRQGSGRAFTRLNHVKQFDQPSDAAGLGKKAKLDDVFILMELGRSACSGPART
jgi:hypothetical protein